MPTGVYVVLAIALVVAFLYLSHRTWPKGNWWGMDFNRPICPRCGTPKPRLRIRKPTLREWILGGWTCSNCGCHADKYGRERAA